MSATVYRIIDPASVDTEGPELVPGGGSGTPLCADFTAPSVAAAMQIGYIICAALQRPGLLVPLTSAPPYTQIVSVGPGVALTSVPSGVGF